MCFIPAAKINKNPQTAKKFRGKAKGYQHMALKNIDNIPR